MFWASLGVGWVSLLGEWDHSSIRCPSVLYSVPALTLTFHSSLIMGVQNIQIRDVFEEFGVEAQGSCRVFLLLATSWKRAAGGVGRERA